jgi:hypothetical protein
VPYEKEDQEKHGGGGDKAAKTEKSPKFQLVTPSLKRARQKEEMLSSSVYTSTGAPTILFL